MNLRLLWRDLNLLPGMFVAVFLATGVASATQVSSGSGFFISQNGYLATCYHVIEGQSRIVIRSADGTTRTANVVAADRANDLAILRVEGDGFPFLTIRRSSEVRKGEEVIVFGFPNIAIQGTDVKVTQGIISGLTGVLGEPNSFQVSAAVQPGNSGGPLVDRAGNVVGVVSAKLNQGRTLQLSGALPENVNYAVKSNYLLELIEVNSRMKVRLAAPAQRAPVDAISAIVQRTESATVLILVESTEASTTKIEPTKAPPQTQSPPQTQTPPPNGLPPSASFGVRPYKGRGAACGFSSECSVGFNCVNGYCSPRATMPGDTCNSHYQCPRGQWCIGSPNTCQPLFGEGHVCEKDLECSGQSRCSGDRCTPTGASQGIGTR